MAQVTSGTRVKTCDLVRAIRLAERFNICAGDDRDTRIDIVISESLDFMDRLTPHILAAKRLEVGCVHGPIDHLDLSVARAWAVQRESGDDLMGVRGYPLTIPRRRQLFDMRKAFSLASASDALSLAVRTYGWVMDHVWRGNGMVLFNGQNREDLPFDIEKFREQARQAHQSRSITSL